MSHTRTPHERSSQSRSRRLLITILGFLLALGGLSVSVSAAVPGAPQNLALTPGDGQIQLDWDAPLDDGGFAIAQYHVYRGPDADNLVLLHSTGDTSTTYTNTGLGDGETWFYAVSAENADGEGPQTAAVSATTHDVPGAPQNMAATAGAGQIDLSWDAPANDGGTAVTDYKIYNGTTSGALTLLTTIAAASTSHSHTGLGDGETQFYHVVAVNAIGDGAASTEVSATTHDVPGAPQALAAAGGSGNVTLTWTAPASDGGTAITGYEIYGADAAEGPFTKLTTNAAGDLDHVETGLGSGVTRQYRVNATNAIGEGAGATASNSTLAASGGGGGGLSTYLRTTVTKTASKLSTNDEGTDRTFRVGPVWVKEGGLLTMKFPFTEDTMEQIEVRFDRDVSRVMLDVEVLEHESGTEQGFELMRKIEITLRDDEGPLGHDAVREATLVLRHDTSGQAAPDGLLILRYDPSSKTWQAQETTTTEGEDHVLVEAKPPGFSLFALGVDTQGPTIELPSEEKEHAAMDPIVIDVTDNVAVESVQMKVDGKSVDAVLDGSTATFTPAEALSAGSHTIEVTALDAAGNSATESGSLMVADAAADDPSPASEGEEGDEQTEDSPIPGLFAFLAGLCAVVVAARRRRTR